MVGEIPVTDIVAPDPNYVIDILYISFLIEGRWGPNRAAKQAGDPCRRIIQDLEDNDNDSSDSGKVLKNTTVKGK